MALNDPSSSAPSPNNACVGDSEAQYWTGSPEPPLPAGPPPSPEKRTGLRNASNSRPFGPMSKTILDRLQELLTAIRESVSASPDSSEEVPCLEEIGDLEDVVTIAQRKLRYAEEAAEKPGVKSVHMITLSTVRECHVKWMGVVEFELVPTTRFGNDVVTAIGNEARFKETLGQALKNFGAYSARVHILERELSELEGFTVIQTKEETARLFINRVLISALAILEMKPLSSLSVMLGLSPEVRVASYQPGDEPELIEFEGHNTYVSGRLDFVAWRLEPKLDYTGAEEPVDEDEEDMREQLRKLDKFVRVDPVIEEAEARFSLTIIKAKQAGQKQELRAFLPQAIAESLITWQRLKFINVNNKLPPHSGVPFILTNGSEWIFGILIKLGGPEGGYRWKASSTQNLKISMENMGVAGKQRHNTRQLNAILKAVLCWIVAQPSQVQSAMSTAGNTN